MNSKRDIFRKEFLNSQLLFQKKVKEEAEKLGIPAIEGELGQFLAFLLKLINPSLVLEIGAGNGYSSLWLEKGLKKDDALLITVERSRERAEYAKNNIQKNSQGKIQLLYGNALNIFKEKEIFDFIFVDGRKNEYPQYLKLVKRLLKKDGIFVIDNVYFHDYLLISSPPKRYRFLPHLKRMLELLKNDESLEFTLLNDFDGLIIGTKTY